MVRVAEGVTGASTLNIPFSPAQMLKLERYRGDQRGPCARMARKSGDCFMVCSKTGERAEEANGHSQ